MTNTIADVALPPTFVVDSVYLGPKLGIVVGLALCAAAITTGWWVRRKGQSLRVAIVLGLVLYAGLNFGVYLIGQEISRQRRRTYYEEMREQEVRETNRVPVQPGATSATPPTSQQK